MFEPGLGSADFKPFSGARFTWAASAGEEEHRRGGTAAPHSQFSVNQQVAASLLPAAMRSQLLISVAHLPTIRESQEEMLLGGFRQEPPTSPSLDDYVRSICQLVQPTSVLDKPAAKDRLRRPHWPAWASEESSPTRSPYDITTHSSTQHPTLPEAGTADPLDWLFGKSQEKKPSWRDTSRTGSSADPWGLHRQMDSRKAQGVHRMRLCDARVQGHSLERPSRDWHLGSWASGQHDQAAAFPTSCCPSSVLRTLHLHLPVIHEL